MSGRKFLVAACTLIYFFKLSSSPGGIAFVRTAAYAWMRSGHDEAIGSQRRYSLGALERLLAGAGFNVLRATYANGLLLPVAGAPSSTRLAPAIPQNHFRHVRQ